MNMQYLAALQGLETVHVDRGVACPPYNQTDKVKYQPVDLFQPILVLKHSCHSPAFVSGTALPVVFWQKQMSLVQPIVVIEPQFA